MEYYVLDVIGKQCYKCNSKARSRNAQEGEQTPSVGGFEGTAGGGQCSNL